MRGRLPARQRTALECRGDAHCTLDDRETLIRYVAGTHEVPAGLSVQSTEHPFHDKSLAPECIRGE
jgi:hypothetical protein